jgi:hypothetical protein
VNYQSFFRISVIGSYKQTDDCVRADVITHGTLLSRTLCLRASHYCGQLLG